MAGEIGLDYKNRLWEKISGCGWKRLTDDPLARIFISKIEDSRIQEIKKKRIRFLNKFFDKEELVQEILSTGPEISYVFQIIGGYRDRITDEFIKEFKKSGFRSYEIIYGFTEIPDFQQTAPYRQHPVSRRTRNNIDTIIIR